MIAAAAPISDFAASLAWYRDRPVEFVIDVINAVPDEWQAHVMRLVSTQSKVAVASCTGAGKDAVAAWLLLWFLVTRPYSKIPCTASTREQLFAVLWAEVHKWMRHSGCLGSVLEWNQTSVRHRAAPEEWFAVARTTSSRLSSNGDRQAEGLAGFHGDHLLFIIDEASGVEREHFEAAEGTLTGKENKLLVLGNPLRSTGTFFDIFHKPTIARYWSTAKISAVPHPGADFVAPHASDQNASDLIDQYGAESAIVQARVYGQFPTALSTDTGFTFEEVIAAMSREVIPSPEDEVQIGVDCARFGDDETVYQIRRGYHLRTVVDRKKGNIDVAGRILDLAAEEPDRTRPEFGNQAMIVVDETGVGGGVCDILWAQGFSNVYAVSFGESPYDSDRFYNLAAEMWLQTLKNLIGRLQLPNDEVLLHQLISRRYSYTGRGLQRRLETKDEMRRRGLASPDRADALCLAVVQPPMPGVY